MEPLVAQHEVTKLIPQRHPILLVDQLLSYTKEEAVSGFHISSDHIFVDKNGFLTESGLIENIAQTTAMHQGYEYYIKGVPAPEGYIGSIRKLRIIELPPVNTTLKTRITIVSEILGVTIISGQVLYNGKEIAHGEMRLVQVK